MPFTASSHVDRHAEAALAAVTTLNTALGAMLGDAGSDQLAALVLRERERWTGVVRRAHLHPVPAGSGATSW